MAKTEPRPAIRVRNLQRRVRVNVRGLEKQAARALQVCLQLNKTRATTLRSLIEINVVLVSDERMASLHQQFLHESGPTDVLTFEHGEIVISAETAAENARTFKNPVARELLLYIVHGLLHLHGFDDRTQGARRKMEAIQKKIIEEIA